MLRSRRVLPSNHQHAKCVVSTLMIAMSARNISTTTGSLTTTTSFLNHQQNQTTPFRVENNINNTIVPMIRDSMRCASAAQSMQVTEEDTDADLDGLGAFASHSFTGSSVALVSVAWADVRVQTLRENPNAVAPTIIFTVNTNEDIGNTAKTRSASENSGEEKAVIKQKAFPFPGDKADQSTVDFFKAQVSNFLTNAAEMVSDAVTTVVVLPWDAKSGTYRRLRVLLSEIPQEKKQLDYFFSESDCWSQVYSLYNEHRIKNRGMSMPRNLESAYKHLTDINDFVPTGPLVTSSDFDTRFGAFLSELSLETLLLAVKRLCPPMKHLVKSGTFSPRELAVAQACARVVRPVHYFTMRIDNQLAKSVRDRTAIRIEVFNPQTGKNTRIELASVKDPKLDALTALIGSDVNGVTALFLTSDTTSTAQQSILRAIRPKNPIFTLQPHNLASYLDEDGVAVAERFAEGFQFSNNPKAMWDQLLGAVTSPTPLVQAIVGAAHHRLKVAKSYQQAAGGNSIPKQDFIKANALKNIKRTFTPGFKKQGSPSTSHQPSEKRDPAGAAAGTEEGSEDIPDDNNNNNQTTSAPRSAFADRVSNEKVQSHSKWRNVRSDKEQQVADALQAWQDSIFNSPDRSKREQACADKLERFLVVDLETTTNSKYKRIANPFTGENYVVLPGAIDHNGEIFMPSKYLKKNDKVKLPDLSQYDVIVGHNIKFDMMYLWSLPEVRDFLYRGGLIWDTMYAEYLLSGHEVRLGQGAGLDAVAASYGGKIKKLDEVKEAWANGVQTYDIAYSTLAEYLRGDLRNTEFIFRKQRSRALAQKQVNIIQHRMDSLLCTTEMEYNGLYMNVPLAKSHTDKLGGEMKELKAKLDSFVPKEIPPHFLREFNWGSMTMLMSVFFGIPLKFDPLSSSQSFRNGQITIYGGVDNLEGSANLAFLSNNLQGMKVLNRYIKPYLRSRGLRTSAALEEAFDDRSIEMMFETFFYAVETEETSSSSKKKKDDNDSDAATTTASSSNNSALNVSDLSPEAKKSAENLLEWENKKVTRISVANLSEKLAFEGIVDPKSSGSKADTTTKSKKITLDKTTGQQYDLKTTTVRAQTFEAVTAALNKWLNDILVSTTPPLWTELQKEQAVELPRVALLLGRRNAEYYQPILNNNGFSTRKFESDSRIPTKIVFGEDSGIETCALRTMSSEMVIPKMYSAIAPSSATAPLGKAPKKGANSKKVSSSDSSSIPYRLITVTSKTPEIAADLLEREAIDGKFEESNTALYRAVLYGDRAFRLSKLIVGDYHRKKRAFLEERKKNPPPAGKDKPLKLNKKVSEKDVPLEARAFKTPGIPPSCFLDAPFASQPSVNRAQQLVLLRCIGSQLKDDDAFAYRMDTPPKYEIEIEGKLQQYIKDDVERREVIAKFTSPETKKLLVGEETLSFFAKKGDELAKTLLDNRGIEKQLSTYYEDKKSGMMALVHSNDSCIHHELVHNKTTTGRLSSANPNCQNIPKEDKSPIRELFVSRFGDEGVCIEADYSQLEVVVLCCLSKDKQMTEDLFNKVDFHCKRVAMMRPEYTYEEVLQRAKKDKEPEFVKMRSQAKIFSFQRQYGAGVKMLSESTGLPPETIKQIIEKEKVIYAGTDTFYDMVGLSCHTFDPSLQTGSRNKHGDPIYKGLFPVLTGSRYIFTQSDVPFEVAPGEPTTNYSPTHLKNYPVQGFAGEIVQIMLGQLYRHFVKTKNYGGKAILTNTVHDCVWIDAKKEVAEEVAADCNRIMSNARQVLNDNWPEIECVVEFPVDVVVGPNMGHMENTKSFFAKMNEGKK